MFKLSDSRLIEALLAILPELDALGVQVWIIGKTLSVELPSGMVYVDTLNECSDPIPRSLRDEVPNDTDALYLFTSGTTGRLLNNMNIHNAPVPITLIYHNIIITMIIIMVYCQKQVCID